MYCNLGDWFKEKFVLQRYKGIAIQWSAGVQNCIAIQFTGQQCIAIHCTVLWHETRLPVLQDRRLCRDTALGARLSAGRRRRRAGRRRAAGARGAGARQARLAREAGGEGATGRARAAWVLGARPGYGLCTWCTRPVFDPD